MPKSITSANAIFTLMIPGEFSVPQQLQQFSADDIFGTDPQEIAETAMGVDGRLTGGFVFVPTKQGVSLMADSDSCDVFDQWRAAGKTARDILTASGVIILPAIRKKYSMTRGILTTFPPIADAGKVLKMRKFAITWQDANPAPL